MKVVEVQVIPLSAPIPKEYRWRSSLGYSTKRDTVLLKIITDEGIVGYGEANHGMAPGVVATTIERVLRPLVIGTDPFKIERTWHKMYAACKMIGNRGVAILGISGVELALWDIVGKALNTPVYRLMGAYREEIEVYAGGLALGWKETSLLVEEVQALMEKGFKAVKIRIGRQPREDVDTITAIRKAVGPELRIMVDANGGYSRLDALYVGKALEELNISWLEEPLRPEDLDGLADLAARLDMAIAAGENQYTRYDFNEMLRKDCVDIVQPDCCKVGGLLEARKIAAMASANYLPCAPHIFGTAVCTAANLQLLGCISNGLIMEYDVMKDNPLREGIMQEPFILKGNMMQIPQKPGLGIEIDEKAFEKFPFIDGPSYVAEQTD